MAIIFETTDLYCASALKTFLQLPFPEIEVNGRFSIFRFTTIDSVKAQAIADQFYNDTLHVQARRYAQDIRDLKALIFRAKESSGR